MDPNTMMVGAAVIGVVSVGAAVAFARSCRTERPKAGGSKKSKKGEQKQQQQQQQPREEKQQKKPKELAAPEPKKDKKDKKDGEKKGNAPAEAKKDNASGKGKDKPKDAAKEQPQGGGKNKKGGGKGDTGSSSSGSKKTAAAVDHENDDMAEDTIEFSGDFVAQIGAARGITVAAKTATPSTSTSSGGKGKAPSSKTAVVVEEKKSSKSSSKKSKGKGGGGGNGGDASPRPEGGGLSYTHTDTAAGSSGGGGWSQTHNAKPTQAQRKQKQQQQQHEAAGGVISLGVPGATYAVGKHTNAGRSSSSSYGGAKPAESTTVVETEGGGVVASTEPKERVEIEIESKYYGVIIGEKGATLKLLTSVTGCTIDVPKKDQVPKKDSGSNQVPKKDSGSGKVVITGERENVQKAKQAILSLIHKGFSSVTNPLVVSSEISVPTQFHGLLVGPKGAHLKAIQDATHTKIAMPTVKTSTRVVVSGEDKAQVKTARDTIKQLIEQGFSPVTHPGFVSVAVPFPNDRLALLIGPRGQTIKSIQGDTKTKVNIPDTRNGFVTVVGLEEGVKRADTQIRRLLIKEQEAIEAAKNAPQTYGDDDDGDVDDSDERAYDEARSRPSAVDLSAYFPPIAAGGVAWGGRGLQHPAQAVAAAQAASASSSTSSSSEAAQQSGGDADAKAGAGAGGDEQQEQTEEEEYYEEEEEYYDEGEGEDEGDAGDGGAEEEQGGDDAR